MQFSIIKREPTLAADRKRHAGQGQNGRHAGMHAAFEPYAGGLTAEGKTGAGDVRRKGAVMELNFLGAAHEVTGSCHYLKVCGLHILVDCGMQQGPDEYENQEIPVNPAEIDYVLLTHAHIDHSGRLPLLYAKGFRGTVIATEATEDLCGIMLRDSAHIQMFEAEWRNRKAKRSGRPGYVPLYDMNDAEGVLKRFRSCRYGEVIRLSASVQARFIDVGHLLGSASIEVTAEENNQTRKIVFSGDIGNLNQPLLRDPQYLSDADYVVMECTYGDRSHDVPPDYARELAGVIQRTFDRGGNVVIPSFAVGRTQELLYFLRRIKAENMVQGHGDFPVYVDSPMAVEATNIFRENVTGYYDQEAMDLIRQGINPLGVSNLRLSVTSDDSKEINNSGGCKVILSASGMCEAGRIKHHLKHNLWRPECTILFVGYQAEGTLGRAILEGADTVKLFGEEIEVRAEICQLSGISGHADNKGLLRWVQSFSPKPKRVFVVHGESSVCDLFAMRLRDEFGLRATAPYPGASYDLLRNTCLNEGVQERVKKPAPSRRASAVFQRLVDAGKRLAIVIRHNEGGANKDLARFADQINALCDKWDR